MEKAMKYFISTKDGPMTRTLGLTDSSPKYIKIIDSLVAEMTPGEAIDLRNKGFIVEREEEYFIPAPIMYPHALSSYFPNNELDPKIPGVMAQMETCGIIKLRDMGYLGDKDVHVGIADTGIDNTHRDVNRNLKYFKDFIDRGNTTPTDPGAHGTAVASIMLGNGYYVSKFHGVAPNISFSAARIMDADGRGNESVILEGIDWLVDQGVDIINLSLGSWLTRYTPFSRAVDNIVARGISVFVAAGNSGPQQISAPANAINAVTCGSCNYKGEYSNFSSVGPAKGPDGISIDKPDIMAWGENVAMSRAFGTRMGNMIDNNYIYASGTSFATPFAAGCGALLKSINKDLTPKQIKDLLMVTAFDSPKYDKYHEGAGNMRIYDAISMLLNGDIPVLNPKMGKSGCLTALFSYLFKK